MALDLIREVMNVDYRVLDPLRRETIEHIVDECLAADRHERLGQLPVESAHARAEPRCQHHGACRRRRNSAIVHQWVLLAGA